MIYFLEDKVDEINKIFERLSLKSRILIWGAGRHTEKLLIYSNILQFCNIIIADKYNYGKQLYGKKVIDIDEVDFGAIDTVVISSLEYQEEIEEELLSEHKFCGEVIGIYGKDEKYEFYKLQSRNERENVVYEGDFDTWEDAERNSLGYGQQNILEKVKQSTLKVLAGEAAYERDSALFKDKEFSFHIIAYIMKMAINREKLVIVDFGGALGSTYLQNREFLQSLPANIEYNIVEQHNFVEEGNKIFKNDDWVNFRYSMDEIQGNIDLILFSGVLQCINNYEEIISKVLERHIEYIIVDRTPLCEKGRICVLKVPESIFSASFPIRIFQREKLLSLFAEEYELEYEFHSFVDGDVYFLDGKVECKGFVFRKSKGKTIE